MKISLNFNTKNYRADLSHPIDISIPVNAGAQKNPNCYWAEPVTFETITADNFIGSVTAGGSVNYKKLTITPHGNGTHTECYGHIAADATATINACLKQYHSIAELITVSPEPLANNDLVISLDQVKRKLHYKKTDSLVIRTLPNDNSKKVRQYSGTNPPYLHHELLAYLNQVGIQHILTDLPSVDKEIDGGKLLAHKAFWEFPEAIRKNCTITELIYVDNSIPDGLYLLNLQIISLEMDASPSKPTLFKLEEVL
jgi:arylformamidase